MHSKIHSLLTLVSDLEMFRGMDARAEASDEIVELCESDLDLVSAAAAQPIYPQPEPGPGGKTRG